MAAPEAEQQSLERKFIITFALCATNRTTLEHAAAQGNLTFNIQCEPSVM
jgi:hypothetical protein